MIEGQHPPVQAPQLIQPEFKIEDFDCGNIELNEWLKKRALKNEDSGASRTYVVTVEQIVIAYYCLATGSIISTVATGKVHRNMPDPIPVIIIGRLAVDINWQDKKIGYALVRDAVLRTLQVSEIAGIRAILVHALTERAKQFYEKCGFIASPIEPLTLMATIKDIKVAFGHK
jgi:N-acetylglutamate synthase-like GNAT family acetyltransferase